MVDKNIIPRHIAIIMDGNGRWAKQRGLSRTTGHRQGIERVREIVRACAALGIKALTIFAFSTENWNRPKTEIAVLMRYLDIFLKKEVNDLHKNNVRLMFIGRGSPLPRHLQKRMQWAEDYTSANTGLTLIIALNYGSRAEIVDAVKKFAAAVVKGEQKIEALDEDTFGKFLYTKGIPDPDLLIRTSGEMRISNFLLWQLSYAEFYFTKKYWPDFTRHELEKAILEYQKRSRRFGALDAD